MNKKQFLAGLKKGLRHLPGSERKKYLDLYTESIDDRIEEGASEEEAVASFGTPLEEAQRICDGMNVPAPDTREKKKLKTWAIVLLAAGSPIWLSLALVALALVLALFIVIWALDLAIWVLVLCFPACGLAGLVGGTALFSSGNIPQGLFLFGCGLICIGIGIFWFILCCVATRSLIKLTSESALLVKRIFTERK